MVAQRARAVLRVDEDQLRAVRRQFGFADLRKGRNDEQVAHAGAARS